MPRAALPVDVARRAERLAGATIDSFTPASGGYTPALRGTLLLADGRRLFLKCGLHEHTGAWLRDEFRFYSSARAALLPGVHGFDAADPPLLLLEDLSHARWPPPWDGDRVVKVLRALDNLASLPPPDHLPRLVDRADEFYGWAAVAADPGPFLSPGVYTREWLDDALPRLVAVRPEPLLDGNSVVHLDIRSDNLCFDGDRVVIVDWNHASIGNPAFDVAFWAPSLEHEGGPPPEVVIPDAGGLAVLAAGFFAARAGLPDIPDAPFVQREQLSTALPWMCRALGLDAPVATQR